MTTLPKPHDLPGIDQSFHEPRKYLSPAVVKGVEILASHGSCKEKGCGYRSAWTNNSARDKGMWLHRALRVREARVTYFGNLFGNDSLKVARLFEETADNNSHYLAPWMMLVKKFYSELLGIEVEQMPTQHDYLADYNSGQSAMDTAKFLLEAGLR